jgi:hypothetical protein
MARRSPSQTDVADQSFPIRIKFVVPPRGLGTTSDDLWSWLNEHVGRGQFAIHPAPMLGGSAIGVHLRDLVQAQALVAAFPWIGRVRQRNVDSYYG